MNEFWELLRQGNREAVRRVRRDAGLLERRCDSGQSPIRLARECGHAALAGELAGYASRLDAFDAIAAGDLGALQAALEDEESAGYSSDGWTALHLAAFYGEAAIVDWLLEQGADPDRVSMNPMANTPLGAALAGALDLGIVDALIETGADVNVRGGGGVTPLHLAAARGNVIAVERLLAAGADREAATEDGKSAPDLARERGHPEVAEVLLGG